MAWVPKSNRFGADQTIRFLAAGSRYVHRPTCEHFSQSGPMRGLAWIIVVAEMSWRTSISEPGITTRGEGSTVSSFAAVA
ncbi:MAG: hypothetical protein QOD88_1919 [Mycobacterium sp.]|nr:hypothetical protein [Mycobacterium sp.]